MHTKTIHLHNGFINELGERVHEAEIRKLDGEDEDLLLNKAELRKGNTLDRLLKNCILRLGNETKPEMIAKQYDKHLLMADMMALLCDLRAWSIGDRYAFEAQCQHCQHISAQRISLSTLDRKDAPDDHRWQKDHTVKVEATEGSNEMVLVFRDLLARDTGTMELIKQQYPKEQATRQLALQLITLNGEKVAVDKLKKFSMADRNSIRKAFDSVVGGIDMELLMDCPKCERTFKGNLPVDLRSFFFQATDITLAQEARPFLTSGATSKSLEESFDGALAKSESSVSKSELTT